MQDKKNVIAGYSGHAFVVADAAREAGIALHHYTDLKETKLNPFDLSYLGSEKDPAFKGWDGGYAYMLGIGDNRVRRKTAEFILSKGAALLIVVHPSAGISKTARLGKGVFVNRNAAVNALALIGDFCILNTGCIVEHECRLGTAVHLAPGAVLAGNVTIGENTFVGAGAVIKQGVKVGKDVIIGAGAVVLNDIEDGAVYVGNPARKTK